MGKWTDLEVGTASNVFAPVIIGFFKKIYRSVRYLFIHDKNAKKLDEEMELLIVTRASVQQEADAAERNLEKQGPDVQHWFKRVDKKIDEVRKKKAESPKDRAKGKCFPWLWSNVIYRYQLSREAEEDAGDVDELLQQTPVNNVAVREVPEALINPVPKNFTAFDSRKEIFNQIVKVLEDPTISMAGVYGIGGVGKTTLVNEVARQVKEDDLFCRVVHVDVTLTPDIKNIQGKIAVSLGLELKEDDISVRAYWLLKRLENEKKILIILDNIWDQLHLEEVEIPFGDQHNGSKLQLISRNRHVLTNKMDAKKVFRIGDLEEEEAWNLFKKMAENDFENPDLLSVATKAVRKCAGLPLAIVTVARALRKKDLPTWRNALCQLQMPSPANFTKIPSTVYSAIHLSYNYLRNEELKQTFLLCCQLGHNADIEDLLRCAIGLRLFGDVKKVGVTRDGVLTEVSELKDSCLLLDGDNDDDHLFMHDYVCDVALAIAYNAFVLRHGDVFEHWPNEERMKKLESICLSFASNKMLSHQLECPQLRLFSMAASSKDSYVEVPPSFFEKMKNIEVLHLIQMDFSSPPSSISFPTSLRTLCLKQCKLGDMTNLGKLKNLEILNLSCSNIEILPEEIGHLTKLRLLDLSGCTKLRIISPSILSSLSSLEELYEWHYCSLESTKQCSSRGAEGAVMFDSSKYLYS